MKERETSGAHYIVTFYNNIQQLNHLSSQYDNLLLEFKSKYGDNPDPKKVSDEERAVLSSVLQNIRHYAKLAYIGYKSIYPTIKKTYSKIIEDAYIHIKEQYVIKKDVLDIYVIELNKILVEDIIRDLLLSSQDIYSQIYNNATSQ